MFAVTRPSGHSQKIVAIFIEEIYCHLGAYRRAQKQIL